MSLPAELKGSQGSVPSEAVDLSRNGVLLRVSLEALVRAQPDVPHTDSFALLVRHFSGVFRVRFPEPNVSVRAQLVRIAMEPDLPGEFLVGVRFRRPLSHKQLRRLGLTPEACGPERDAAEDAAD